MKEERSDKKREQEKSPREILEQKTQELNAEELTDLLKRTQANFENYRKQNQAYIEEIKKMAAKDVVLQILPILDNFELALKAVPQEQEKSDFIQGIKLIHSQILQILQQNNIVPLETVNKEFDPFYHEALMKVPSEAPAGKIIGEFQKGFTMHDKLLRSAKVKVSAGPVNQFNNSQENNQKNSNANGGN